MDTAKGTGIDQYSIAVLTEVVDTGPRVGTVPTGSVIIKLSRFLVQIVHPFHGSVSGRHGIDIVIGIGEIADSAAAGPRTAARHVIPQ